MKPWIRALITFGSLTVLTLLETRRPLRDRTESPLPHAKRNLLLAGMSAAVIQMIETPIVRPIVRKVHKHKLGILQSSKIPKNIRLIAAVLLMDYTLYLWHIMAHRLAVLWRFHVVHHLDRDLDASTALRFHFGELVISVPWRAAQVLIIGVDKTSFEVWQTFLSLSILFHHSNIKFPLPIERLLSWFFVTPRMHGIHHSDDARIAGANWSSGLAIWDRLHGTYRMNLPQSEITIGILGGEDPDLHRIRTLLILPFRVPKFVWNYLTAK